MIDLLVDKIKSEKNITLDEARELRSEIREAVNNQHIKFIEKDGVGIGFFTWIKLLKDDRLHIYIDNMYVEPQYRNKNNFLFLRRFLRDKYPYAYMFYWHNDKNDKYYYCR